MPQLMAAVPGARWRQCAVGARLPVPRRGLACLPAGHVFIVGSRPWEKVIAQRQMLPEATNLGGCGRGVPRYSGSRLEFARGSAKPVSASGRPAAALPSGVGTSGRSRPICRLRPEHAVYRGSTAVVPSVRSWHCSGRLLARFLAGVVVFECCPAGRRGCSPGEPVPVQTRPLASRLFAPGWCSRGRIGGFRKYGRHGREGRPRGRVVPAVAHKPCENLGRPWNRPCGAPSDGPAISYMVSKFSGWFLRETAMGS